MEKRIKIVIAIIVIILFIVAGVLIMCQIYTISGDPRVTHIEFHEDVTNKTLTVVNMTPADLSMNWNEVLLISGNATFPTGTVSVGDIITNCSDSGELGYNFRQRWNFCTGWKTVILPFGSWDYTS